MILNTGYIACAQFKETIRHFCEANTPEKALSDFIEGGDFKEFCEYSEFENKTKVEVKVFKAIYASSPDANHDLFEDGWQWILGDEVNSTEVLYTHDD